MNDIAERDQRVIRAWCRWYPNFCDAILRIAARILPRRLYMALERFAVDTAEPMGKFAGWCWCNYRDAGDILRWLVYG